jgi:VIT1/CCC1 family predicted Fe2+/Mn2+ transporter
LVTQDPASISKERRAGADASAPKEKARAVLDPVDRLSEIVFGLIMAMTFTASIHAAQAGQQEIRTVLFAAIGCNIAWGIVDAAMYLLTTAAERHHSVSLQRKIMRAAGSLQARQLVSDELPDRLADSLAPEDLDTFGEWIARQPAPPAHTHLGLDDLRGGLAVFLLVSLSTLPVVLPFVFLHDPVVATHVSHWIAVAMLFGCGTSLGRYAGLQPLAIGTLMAVVGLVLVAVAVALGG